MPQDGFKPNHIALVLCDSIYSDPTGKLALVGLFNGITGSGFPLTHPRLAVFVSLTGLRSGMVGKLEIVRGDNEEPIVSTTGEFPPSSPIDILDMQFFLNNVVFPEPGTYFIRFSGNGHPLAQRPFEIRERHKGKSKQ